MTPFYARKDSPIGKEALRAAASFGQNFGEGVRFAYNGSIFMVTSNHLYANNNYFQFKPCEAEVAVAPKLWMDNPQKGTPVEFEGVPKTFVEDTASLDDARADLQAVTNVLSRHGYTPGRGNSVADNVGAAIEDLTGLVNKARESFEEVRKTLAMFGIKDDGMPSAPLIYTHLGAKNEKHADEKASLLARATKAEAEAKEWREIAERRRALSDKRESIILHLSMGITPLLANAITEGEVDDIPF